MLNLSKHRVLLAVLGVFTLFAVAACGSAAAPTAVPAPAAPAIDTAALGAMVQQAVAAAVPAAPQGVSKADLEAAVRAAAPKGVSKADLEAAVRAAVPEAPAPVSAEEIQRMVQSAVAAAAKPGATAAEVKSMVDAAVTAATAQASAQAVSKQEIADLVAKAVAAEAAKGPSPISVADIEKVVSKAVEAQIAAIAVPTPPPSAPVIQQRPLVKEQTMFILRYGCCNLLPYNEGGWGRQFQTWTSMMPLKFDKNNEIVPHLALSYDTSADGKTFTLHLDPRAVFHDGTPVTAASVKKAWEFGAMPEQQVSWGGLGNNLKDVVGIDPVKAGDATEAEGLVALDDHTLQITLSQRDVVYPKKMAQWLMGVWKSDQAETDPDWKTQPIGVGPYRVTADLDKKYIEWTAAPNWWKVPVIIQKVEEPSVPDQQTQMVMYENGEVDLIFAGPGFQAEPHNPNHPFFKDLYRIPYGGIYYYALDNSKPPLDDPKIRAAIAHGYDQNTVVKAVFGDGGIPAYGLVTPETACYQDETKNPGYAYDVELAKKLLKESKYGSAANTPPMLISLPAGYDANWIRYTEAMQAQLQENLGIRLEIQVYERGQTPPESNFSRRSMGITTADPAYPIWIMGYSESPAVKSRSKFKDPVLDQMIDYAQTLALDDPKRCEAYQAAENQFLSGYHLLPTIQVNYPYLVQPWVNNFEMSVNNDMLNLPTMSISERVRFELKERRRY